jgi:hypothetical protein
MAPQVALKYAVRKSNQSLRSPAMPSPEELEEMQRQYLEQLSAALYPGEKPPMVAVLAATEPQMGEEVIRDESGAIVAGVGTDAPTVVNEHGGKQSDSPYSLVSSFPHRAVLDVAKVVRYGLVKYEPDNWRLISRNDHLNHVLVHLFAYLAGDRQDSHLEHAACRILFALET